MGMPAQIADGARTLAAEIAASSTQLPTAVRTTSR